MTLGPRQKKLAKAAISWMAAFSLLLNSVSGVFFAVPYAFAQEEPTTETAQTTESVPEPSPEPEVEVTPVPSPTPEPQPEAGQPLAETPSPSPTLEVSPPPEVIEPTISQTEIQSEPEVLAGINTSGGLPLSLLEETPESESSAQLVPSLSTDQADYSPSDTVTIDGSNFPVNSNLTIRVTWPDGLVRDAAGNVGSSDTVTTDEAGSFVYLYPLRGEGQIGTYLVEVLMGATVLASTTFTDNPIQLDWVQCENDSDNNNVVDSPMCNWINGSLNQNNSILAEGNTVPPYPPAVPGHVNYRAIFEGLVVGTYKLTIKYEFTKGGKVAFDFLTTNYGVTNPNLCEDLPGGVSTTDCNTLVSAGPSTSTFPLDFEPVDATLGSGAISLRQTEHDTAFAGFSPRTMKIYGATNPNITNLARSGPDTGNSGDSVEVTFVKTDSSGPVIATWGGHFGIGVPSPVGYGTGKGAASISGAPFHMTFDGLARIAPSVDSNVISGNKDRSVSPTTLLPPGSITIIKDAVPNDPQDFSFTTTGSDLSSFSLDDDSDLTLSNTKTFVGLGAGTYTVTEGIVSGFTLTNISCTDPSGGTTTDVGTRIASINLASGETVTCTFTNTQQNGHLIVQKTTIPGGDEASFAIEATGSGTIVNGTSGSISDSTDHDYEVTPGTYSVTETVPAGWDETSNSCSAVDVSAGETEYCEIVNTKRGHIIVDKVTDPSGELQSFDFTAGGTGYINFSLTDADSPNNQEVIPGAYSVSEGVVSGWDSDGGVCDQGETPASFDVEPGETVTCTFTNTQRGSISGFKFEDLDGSLSTLADQVPVVGWVIELWSCITDFTSCTDTGQTATTVSSGFFSFANLVPGLYQLIEQIQTGWTDLTSDSINVTLEPGESDENNNFVNTQFGKIIVDKVTDPSGSTQSFEFNLTGGPSSLNQSFSLTDASTPHDSGDVLPGSEYSISETVPAGWDLTSATCGDGSPVDNITVSSNEIVTCTFTNTQRGHIIIEKNAIPDSSQEFTFNNDFDNGNPATFGLTDDSTPGLPSFDAEVLPGTYSVSEDPVSGWKSPESVSCSDQSPIGAIEVSPGETVTCTFTNEKLATITLVKNTVGGDAAFDFIMAGDGLPGDTQITTVNNTGSKTFSNLDPDNTYTISETVPSGWNLTNAECTGTNSPGSITPNAGEEITCTFTNIQRGSITVVKFTDPETDDSTEFEFTSDFGDLTLIGNGDSKVFSDLVPDEYGLEELVPSGWQLTDVTCTGEEEFENGGTILLSPGEEVVCEFTNTQEGTIIVEKQTVPDGELQTFSFSADVSGTISDGGTISVGGLLPDAYTSTETVPANWTLTDITCDDGNSTGDLGTATATFNLDAGEVVTCTFTNTRDTGEIVILKILDEDGDLETIEDQTPAEGWVFNVDGSGPDTDDPSLDPTDEGGITETGLIRTGEYTVVEDVQSGYHIIFAGCFVVGEDEEVGAFDGTDSVDEVEVGKDEVIFCVFINTRDRGSIHGFKFNDEDGDGIWGGEEDALSGWTIELYENADGELGDLVDTTETMEESLGEYWFEDVLTGSYFVCEVQQEGWVQTYPADNGCHEATLSEDGDELTELNFGNLEVILGLTLTKDNDKESGAAPGDTLTYTLFVTNTGNTSLDVIVIDALPGGFTYVAGSSQLDGVPVGDPTASGGMLTWSIGVLEPEESAILTFQATIPSDVVPGIYTNLAISNGTGSFVESNSGVPVFSSVPISLAAPLSASVVGGQILGAATELPAAGAETGILVAFLLLILSGLALRATGFAVKKGWIRKKLISIALLLPFLLLGATTPARAVIDTVAIQDLSTYMTTDNFKISYSALSDNPVTAQFFVRKDGDAAWTSFGGTISGSSGQVQVTGAQIYGGDGLYHFKVEINGGAASDETSATIDRSAPGSVSDYRKERTSPTSYRLFWKTPGDSDFSRVFIYRSKNPQFTADGSTKVGELGGAPSTNLSWDNFGLESDVTYYYALRAVDVAGNASGIVADPETTVVIPGPTVQAAATAAPGAEEEVTALPEEGEILGEKEGLEPSPTPTPQAGGLLPQVLEGGLPFGTILLGLFILFVLGLLGWWLLRR